MDINIEKIFKSGCTACWSFACVDLWSFTIIRDRARVRKARIKGLRPISMQCDVVKPWLY